MQHPVSQLKVARLHIQLQPTELNPIKLTNKGRMMNDPVHDPCAFISAVLPDLASI